VPTAEDRLLQRAVARILEAIYEADFLEVSYGYRPGRNPHQALRVLRDHIIGGRVNYIYEADIRGFFDHLNHEWLHRMLRLRVGDPVILRLIGKWLRAGVMVNGVVVRTDEGVPQGGPISPILANIYLHYVLDLWFERVFKRQRRGEAYLVRFADDYVACFQHRQDAEAFGNALAERLEKFHLVLAEGKTELIVFGRFAREGAVRQGMSPGRFDFLGFTHVCGRDRKGRFAVIRIPSPKSCRKFLDRAHAWLTNHIHWKRPDQQRHLAMMLQGFYQYFSLAHSRAKLDWVRHEVELQWIRTLRRQGQRRRLRWDILCRSSWFVLPPVPRTLHLAV
jgi:RNA-directed DNA polymerase